MKAIAQTAGVFFCFLAFPFLVTAQRGVTNGGSGMASFGVDVQIRYPDGAPGPAGIHVLLERAEGGVESDCQTVAEGKCTLRPSSSGVFLVRLNAGGYEEQTERVELVGNFHAYVTLTLRATDKTDGLTPASEAPSDEINVVDFNIPEKARQEFSKGEAELKAKEALKAAKHFEKAVKIYDNYPQAYRRLGEAYLEQQDWRKSEEALKRSIELEPKLAASYVDLGAVQNQQKNYTQAEVSLRKGLELRPDATEAKYELAKTYWATNRWQEAAPLVKDVVKEVPELAGAHVLHGNILLKQRDGAGALGEYREYLRLEPQGTMATEVRVLVEKLEKAVGK